ncbi:MAG: hypothetical protein AAGC60_07605 [Acidobacteriota bacterium]
MRNTSVKLALCLAASLSLISVPAISQPSLSIDVQGPSAFPFGALDPGGVLLATPAGCPTPAPGTLCNSARLGLVPGNWEAAELDALSYGRDLLKLDNAWRWATRYCFAFSVDEWAIGDPAAPAPPNVATEGAFGNLEASADVQLTCVGPNSPVAPLPPAVVLGNRSWLDGNGCFPFGGAGLGLVEPNPPFPGIPDKGDNLDAVDFRRPSSLNVAVYFSLDAKFVDPLEGPPINTGTAPANGVFPGDVLISRCTGSFGVYARFWQLGLGERDDLDALILWDNGDNAYVPSKEPFDWLFGDTDQLIFSVRRGSPILGTPDSIFGIPIQEGDLLVPPLGGVGAPGIFLSAETLGLATVRSGTAEKFSDDLDAASAQERNQIAPQPTDDTTAFP